MGTTYPLNDTHGFALLVRTLGSFRPSYDQSNHNWAEVAEMKLGFLNLQKNGKSESLAVKTTYFTH